MLPRLPFVVHLAAGVGGGICIADAMPVPTNPAVLSLCAIATLALLVALLRDTRLPRPAIWFALGLALGGARLASTTEPFWPEDDVRLVVPDWPSVLAVDGLGCLVSGPRRTTEGWRATIRLRSVTARGETLAVSGRASIWWRGSNAPPVTGACLRFSGEMRLPSPALHPWDRQPERAAAARGFAAGISADEIGVVSRQEGLVPRQLGALDRRRLLAERAVASAAPTRAEAWILSLGSGTRSGLSDWDRQLMVRVGLAHLLAVSGLHLGLFALTLARGVEILARRSRWLLVRLGGHRVGALCVPPAAWAYAALTGFGPSAVRAALFISCYCAAAFFERKRSGAGAVGVAALAILLHNPHALYSVSLQLSLSAATSILVVLRLRPRGFVPPTSRGQRLIEATRLAWWTSLAALLGTAPIMAHHFGVLSLSGLAANVLLAWPLAVALVPSAMVALLVAPWWPSVTELLGYLIEAVLAVAFWVLEPLADLTGDPFVVGRPGAASIACWCLTLAALAAALASPGLRRAGLTLACLFLALCVACHPPRGAPPRDLEVWFLPVGQGSATLLRTPSGHTLLVDGGGSATGADPGARVILPLLRGAGFATLDAIAMSHADIDHIGGLVAVARSVRFRELWLSRQCAADPRARPLLTAAREAGAAVRILDAGGPAMRFGTVSVTVLHPGASAHPQSANDGSLVFAIDYEGRTVLLPGDIESRGETQLWSNNALPPIDLMSAPHHGSRTSSSWPLLAHTLPARVVYTVGSRNRFGFPHAEVVSRYRAFAARSYRTDTSGLIRFTLAREGVLGIEHLEPRTR